jgi:hypothetical protein
MNVARSLVSQRSWMNCASLVLKKFLSFPSHYAKNLIKKSIKTLRSLLIMMQSLNTPLLILFPKAMKLLYFSNAHYILFILIS